MIGHDGEVFQWSSLLCIGKILHSNKADGFLNVAFWSLVKATQPDVMLICDDYAVMVPYSSVAI